MFSRKNKISILLIVAVFFVCSILGFSSFYPSKPNYGEDKERLNVKNQVEHIKEIAKEPHTIFDKEAHERVKNYLLSELKSLGLSPKTFSYKDVYVERTGTKEDIENIYAKIDGKNDSYIMLVTHYDSSRAKTERYAEIDGSLGAADAGYGVSTVLETIKTIKENNIELVNGIKILITDGEEYGLLGAKKAVHEEEIFKDVNYLINMEARGTHGPAIMFETSENNSNVIDLYKESYSPFSYSITPEVYRMLPNGTDFSVFLDAGLNGLNISVLDGIENYHTPNDNIANINESSIQHYGDQVYPIVKEFVSNEKYSSPDSLKSEDNSIFFTIGNLFIEYSKITNYILIALTIALLIFLAFSYEVRSILSIFKYTLVNALYILFTMLGGFLVSKLFAMINGREFSFTYLPLIKFEGLIIVSTIVLAFLGYIYVIYKTTNNFEYKREYTIGSLVLLLILTIVLTILLPGGSYLFLFPALIISATLTLIRIVQNDISYISLIPLGLITLLYVPTVYLFNAALTLGALGAYILFAMVGIISIFICSLEIIDINRNKSKYTFECM